ncbi:MAG: Lrp/AsnC family transcriptional regulator [Rhodocyclaceae bacterium]|nr:Lrp/AsnC family transcriptional regulator [Rhodocyclaceae bacterium]MCA3020437.1 Lrp/AsnC family transcriptional regulator [Rhodocyclaceae bacterium]MCA3021941.1 Lrp/AsnC family transcriptional regulator [Rhodocyclaceae bacterium]MCA3025776.1 Lrp/AsnC family transcriptional regulator [Rhodocyclaceae bacterium]MCA3031809.1 Lrp/AsnC family transcriptional regulator [Rhodocyclaceae bacterium]
MARTASGLTKAETLLLDILRRDARRSVAEIARELGLARATVQERIRRLEEGGVIEGYTVRLNPAHSRSRVTAHTLVRIDARKADGLYAKLKRMPSVSGIYAISGEFDVLVVLQAETTADLDEALDILGRYEGVERTQTSIVLSVKYEH